MTATYTFDIFTTLDGYGSYEEPGDWGGYWGKDGPELVQHRFDQFEDQQRMVFGAGTYRQFVELLCTLPEGSGIEDSWVGRMRAMPATIISSTLEAVPEWPDATLVRGDAVDIVRRLKEESDAPLRSHGSIVLNRDLMAAGLVDRLQVTVFPVLSGQTGTRPVFAEAADFDLELIEQHTLDGHILELVYRPTLHG